MADSDDRKTMMINVSGQALNGLVAAGYLADKMSNDYEDGEITAALQQFVDDLARGRVPALPGRGQR